jgi:glyoxylase-like metal-dependent hydrolase (beta-lactamase superfamily II)
MGTKWGEKGGELFDLQVSNSWESLLLESAGITPRDINHVIVTHLHFDHVGGLTAHAEDGQSLRPCFKNAQHWISKANYMYASDPSPREKASYRSENWEVLFDRRQVELVEQDLREEPRQILPGVFVERSDGHTVGQQIVHVQPQGHKGLVFAADLLPTHHHLKESWGMGYDSQPLLVLEEKKELLRRAAHHDWNIILEHDSQKEMIQVEEQKSARGAIEFVTRP